MSSFLSSPQGLEFLSCFSRVCVAVSSAHRLQENLRVANDWLLSFTEADEESPRHMPTIKEDSEDGTDASRDLESVRAAVLLARRLLLESKALVEAYLTSSAKSLPSPAIVLSLCHDAAVLLSMLDRLREKRDARRKRSAAFPPAFQSAADVNATINRTTLTDLGTAPGSDDGMTAADDEEEEEDEDRDDEEAEDEAAADVEGEDAAFRSVLEMGRAAASIAADLAAAGFLVHVHDTAAAFLLGLPSPSVIHEEQQRTAGGSMMVMIRGPSSAAAGSDGSSAVAAALQSSPRMGGSGGSTSVDGASGSTGGGNNHLSAAAAASIALPGDLELHLEFWRERVELSARYGPFFGRLLDLWEAGPSELLDLCLVQPSKALFRLVSNAGSGSRSKGGHEGAFDDSAASSSSDDEGPSPLPPSGQRESTPLFGALPSVPEPAGGFLLGSAGAVNHHQSTSTMADSGLLFLRQHQAGQEQQQAAPLATGTTAPSLAPIHAPLQLHHHHHHHHHHHRHHHWRLPSARQRESHDPSIAAAVSASGSAPPLEKSARLQAIQTPLLHLIGRSRQLLEKMGSIVASTTTTAPAAGAAGEESVLLSESAGVLAFLRISLPARPPAAEHLRRRQQRAAAKASAAAAAANVARGSNRPSQPPRSKDDLAEEPQHLSLAASLARIRSGISVVTSSVQALRDLEMRTAERLRPLAARSQLQRRWLRYSLAFGLLAWGSYQLATNGTEKVSLFVVKASNSISNFYQEHMAIPLKEMAEELLRNKREDVADKLALEDAKSTLRTLLRNFNERLAKNPELLATLPEDLRSAEALRKLTETGNMRAVSERFAAEVQQPIKNVLQGDLVEILLINIAAIKREVLAALVAMDAVLAENRFNLTFTAMLPSFAILYGVGKGLISLVRTAFAPVDTADANARVKLVLRDILRLLLLAQQEQERQHEQALAKRRRLKDKARAEALVTAAEALRNTIVLRQQLRRRSKLEKGSAQMREVNAQIKAQLAAVRQFHAEATQRGAAVPAASKAAAEEPIVSEAETLRLARILWSDREWIITARQLRTFPGFSGAAGAADVVPGQEGFRAFLRKTTGSSSSRRSGGSGLTMRYHASKRVAWADGYRGAFVNLCFVAADVASTLFAAFDVPSSSSSSSSPSALQQPSSSSPEDSPLCSPSPSASPDAEGFSSMQSSAFPSASVQLQHQQQPLPSILRRGPPRSPSRLSVLGARVQALRSPSSSSSSITSPSGASALAMEAFVPNAKRTRTESGATTTTTGGLNTSFALAPPFVVGGGSDGNTGGTVVYYPPSSSRPPAFSSSGASTAAGGAGDGRQKRLSITSTASGGTLPALGGGAGGGAAGPGLLLGLQPYRPYQPQVPQQLALARQRPLSASYYHHHHQHLSDEEVSRRHAASQIQKAAKRILQGAKDLFSMPFGAAPATSSATGAGASSLQAARQTAASFRSQPSVSVSIAAGTGSASLDAAHFLEQDAENDRSTSGSSTDNHVIHTTATNVNNKTLSGPPTVTRLTEQQQQQQQQGREHEDEGEEIADADVDAMLEGEEEREDAMLLALLPALTSQAEAVLAIEEKEETEPQSGGLLAFALFPGLRCDQLGRLLLLLRRLQTLLLQLRPTIDFRRWMRVSQDLRDVSRPDIALKTKIKVVERLLSLADKDWH